MIVKSVDISDLETMQEMFRLRGRVWSSLTELPLDFFPQGMWKDCHDSHASHWAVKSAGRVIASARLCIHQSITETQSAYLYNKLIPEDISPVATLNRLVVLFEARHQGLSNELDAIRISAARGFGCKIIIGAVLKETGVSRIKCMEDQGFQIVGHAMNRAEPPAPLSPVTILALVL